MDDAGRAGHAVPWAEVAFDALAVLVLEEHHQVPLQDEEDFLDLVGVRGVAFAGGHIHHAQCKGTGGNDGVVFLPAGVADEAMLRPSIAIDEGVGEGGPVRLAVAETGDLPVGDVLDVDALEFRRSRMARDVFRHGVCSYMMNWLVK